MTDEVARLRELANKAAEGEKKFEQEFEEAERVSDAIMKLLPQEADMATAALMMALLEVAEGLEEQARGAGPQLLGLCIHTLMVEALEMGGRDA